MYSQLDSLLFVYSATVTKPKYQLPSECKQSFEASEIPKKDERKCGFYAGTGLHIALFMAFCAALTENVKAKGLHGS